MADSDVTAPSPNVQAIEGFDGAQDEWRMCALLIVCRDVKAGVPPWTVIVEECRALPDGRRIYRSQQVGRKSFETFGEATAAADAWVLSGMKRCTDTPIMPARYQAVA